MGRGARRGRRRLRGGRAGARPRGAPTSTARMAAFAAGLVLIAVALLSPLEHIALTSLLSVHLLQNVILADWAPPLLVLGLSPAMVAAAERRAGRAGAHVAAGRARLLAGGLVRPARAGGVRLRAHAPVGARPRAPRLPDLGHRVLVAGARRRRACAPRRRLVYLFGAFVAAAPVSLALALTHPQYSFYVHAPRLWGISPLDDQQLGAIAMAIEQAAILFTACSVCSSGCWPRTRPATPG